MKSEQDIREKLRQCEEGLSAPAHPIGRYFKAWKDALKWVLSEEDENGRKSV